MKVKKFTAKSMPDVMKSVRNELGNEAVILNSRIVYTGGFLGFFRKKNFEIIAAVDKVINQEPKPIQKDPQNRSGAKLNMPALEQVDQHPEKKNNLPSSSKQTEEILKEITSLKEMIQSHSFMAGQVQGIYPEPVQNLVKWMGEQELSAALTEEFTAALMERWFEGGGSLSDDELLEVLKEEMVKVLADKPFGAISFTKKFINMIGPTGVGKTTTLAKIAADCILRSHKRVAFITTDTYRIAAIDQLKTYAQILKVPVEVCYTLDDFQDAITKFNSYDVVFIDTAGRNFRNKQYVEDLGKVIDFSIAMENYLVLALTSKQKDMEAIYQQFSSLKIDKFIFTKADETNAYGSMINMIEKYGIGAAYITNGQEVPDDCLIASPQVVANLFIGVK